MSNTTNTKDRSFKANSICRAGLMRFVLLIVMGSLAMWGCGEAEEPDASLQAKWVSLPAKMTFTLTNHTRETLTDVMIEGFTYNIKFTKLTSGETRSILASKPMDLVKGMYVSWSGPKGGKRAGTSVSGKIPKNFSGILYFTIQKRGQVTFRAGTV